METPIAFLFSFLLAAAIIGILQLAMISPENRAEGWRRYVTGRNGRYAFGFLLLAWTAGMAVLAALGLPANTVGGPAFLGLLAGCFIFMGFIWAVIGS